MKDPVQEYIEAYREVFAKDMKLRARAAALNEEAANLGVDVIEKGARELLAKYKVDIDEIEKSNEQLSQRVAKRVQKIDEELSHVPEGFKDDRRRLSLMQQVGCLRHTDPYLWPGAGGDLQRRYSQSRRLPC